MDRESFHILLRKYLDGVATPEENRMVNHWYDLLEDNARTAISEHELNEVESRMWDKIQAGTMESAEIPRIHKLKQYRRQLAVAASVMVLIAGIWAYQVKSKIAPSLVSVKAAEGMKVEFNSGLTMRQIKLEDGSTVKLEPSAKIAFPVHFDKQKREVYLEGEAFFDVAKNPGRPFFVYNNKLVAEVLGTSFNIKIIKDRIEVAVRTGRVAVFEDGHQINLNSQQKLENGVIVTPNQKVTYYSQTRDFVTSLVETPMPQICMKDSLNKNKFLFDETPLSEVLTSLEKAYQIEFILENDNLSHCPFTGDISKQNLFNKLEVICSVFQSTYEIKGTRILIKGGKGCTVNAR